MHLNSTQSRSAWTEQEDDLLRAAVKKYGDRAWATVANDVPGRSSKSCSDRWRNFLSPDIEHPRKSPFSEWEVAVVVQAQHRYGNNWKAISMLLPGRTNRAVKNLFVGNLKWGARLPEIQNRYLEHKTPLEDLLEVTPDYPGGPPKERPGLLMMAGGVQRGITASPTSLVAASTSSAGSAWASDMTEQALMGGGLHGAPQHFGSYGARRPRDHNEGGSPTAGMHTPRGLHKRARHARDSPTGHLLHRTSESGAPALLGLDGLPLGLAGLPLGGPMGMPMVGGLMPVMMATDLQSGLPGLQMGLPHPLHAQQLHQQHQQQLHAQHLHHQQQQLQLQPVLAPLCAVGPVSPGSDATQQARLAAPAAPAAPAALLLQGHQSNDSIMLQQIMDQILDDDDVLSDPAISKQLLGSPTSSPLLHVRISGGGGSGALAAGGAQGAAAGRAGAWAGAWGGADGAAGGEGGELQLLHGMVPVGGQQQATAYQVPTLPAARTPSAANLPPRTPGAWALAGAGAAAVPEPAFCHPSRRVSTGELAPSPAAGAAECLGGPIPPTPQPGQQQPHTMRMLCAQLQQENMLLMQRVQCLQDRLVPGEELAGGMVEWHAAG